MIRTKRPITLMVALVLSLSLIAAACGDDDAADNGSTSSTASPDNSGDNDNTNGGDTEISGTLVGAGASAQNAAMTGWQAGFQGIYPDTTIEYDPVGSGGGRSQFLAGGTDFAGSDAYLKDEEWDEAMEVCPGGLGAMNLPHYISPIAIAYNLPGVDTLNLRPEVIAGIFAGEIERWDDPAIAADNPDADLPDRAINAVHRSDESGTTQNFTDYLSVVAPDVWTHGSVQSWPITQGEGAQGTSGVVQAIAAGEGSIGYADASQVSDSLGVVSVGVGDSFVEYTPEAAGRIVDASTRVDGRSDLDFSFDLARDTTEPDTYPIALISYHIVCVGQTDAAKADLLRAFLDYVASPEGQAASAASAGSAPLSEDLSTQIRAAIAQIQVVN